MTELPLAVQGARLLYRPPPDEPHAPAAAEDAVVALHPRGERRSRRLIEGLDAVGRLGHEAQPSRGLITLAEPVALPRKTTNRLARLRGRQRGRWSPPTRGDRNGSACGAGRRARTSTWMGCRACRRPPADPPGRVVAGTIVTRDISCDSLTCGPYPRRARPSPSHRSNALEQRSAGATRWQSGGASSSPFGRCVGATARDDPVAYPERRVEDGEHRDQEHETEEHARPEEPAPQSPAPRHAGTTLPVPASARRSAGSRPAGPRALRA